MNLSPRNARILLVAGIMIIAFGAIVLTTRSKPASTVTTTKTEQKPKNSEPVDANKPKGDYVVTIKELGLQFTVPESLKDITYVIDTDTIPGTKLARLSSTTLENIDSTGCAPDQAVLGMIGRHEGTITADDNDSFSFVKQLPGFVALYGGTVNACGTASEQSSLIPELLDTLPTLTAAE